MAHFKCIQIVRILAIKLFVVGLLILPQPIFAKARLIAWDVFVDQFIEHYFILQPTFAVNAGRHEFDGKLPDWSPAGLTHLRDICQ